MGRYVKDQPDGTGLLTMETITNMATPITLEVDGIVWDVIGWDGSREAMRLKPRAVAYRYVSETRDRDGMHSLEWIPPRGSRAAPVIRRVSFAKLSELQSLEALDPDRDYTIWEIQELTDP
jgi:hypothetical protein